MKRLMTMVVLMVMLMAGIAEACHPWNGITGVRHPWDYSYHSWNGISGVRHPWDYSYHSWNGISGVRHPWDYYSPQVLYGYGCAVGYPNTNVNVRYNERWGIQGGERSYVQSPSLEGKLIDSATLLGALLIVSH